MSTQPGLPYRPEPWDVLRARYNEAVKEVIYPPDVALGRRKPPSSDPKHVFDTPDGLRIIISLERMPDGSVHIHFSASFTPLARRELSGVGEAMQWVVDSYHRISGTRRIPVFMGVSDDGIPHWMIERGH